MKKEPKKVMLGCWAIGGTIRSIRGPDSTVLTVEYGPLSGEKFPAFADVQKGQLPWHLPPLARYTHDGIDFMPFVLYDHVVIDKLAFECMLGARESLSGWKPSKESIEILESLAKDGYITLEDYVARLNDPEAGSLIDAMVLADLSDPNIIQPCKESLRLWIQFYKDLLGLTDYQVSKFYEMLENLESGTRPSKDTFGYLYECVADINRVLVLSQILERAIYEWEDYNQFYKYKFLRTGEKKPKRSPGKTLSELFNVFIPTYRITSYHQLLDIRSDRRLDSIRKLTAVLGDKAITKDLVVQAYEDVLRAKSEIETFSKYTGVLGLILNLLPGPVGDVFELAANSIYQRWRQRNLGWQTFFVERAIQYSKRDIEQALRNQK